MTRKTPKETPKEQALRELHVELEQRNPYPCSALNHDIRRWIDLAYEAGRADGMIEVREGLVRLEDGTVRPVCLNACCEKHEGHDGPCGLCGCEP